MSAAASRSGAGGGSGAGATAGGGGAPLDDLTASMLSLTVSGDVAAGIKSLGSLPQSAQDSAVTDAWRQLSGTSPLDMSSFSLASAASAAGGDPGPAASSSPSLTPSAAFVTLILEAANLGVPADAVKAELERHGLPASTAAAMSGEYDKQAGLVREKHCAAVLQLPRLVDFAWRLDYVVRDSATGKVGQPMYILKISTANCSDSPAVIQHRHFTCSSAQLQDLLARVTDATRAARSLAGET